MAGLCSASPNTSSASRLCSFIMAGRSDFMKFLCQWGNWSRFPAGVFPQAQEPFDGQEGPGQDDGPSQIKHAAGQQPSQGAGVDTYPQRLAQDDAYGGRRLAG